MPNQFKSSIRGTCISGRRGVFLRLTNATSLQLTFTFEPLTHQPPQHFSTVVTKGWSSIGMNEKSVRADLKVFKCSRSCNDKTISKINKTSNNMLHFCGTLSHNKANSFWALWWWTYWSLYCISEIKRLMIYLQLMILYLRLMIHLHTTMATRKRIKLLLQTCSNNFSKNIFPIKRRRIKAYQIFIRNCQAFNHMLDLFQNTLLQTWLTTSAGIHT